MKKKLTNIFKFSQTEEKKGISRKTYTIDVEATKTVDTGGIVGGKRVYDVFCNSDATSDVPYDLANEIASKAIDIINDNDCLDDVLEAADNSCSVSNFDRLQLLDINNQEDITEILTEYRGAHIDIATACACWYDRQVQAAILIFYPLTETE